MKLALTQLAEGDTSFQFSSQNDAWVRELIQSVAQDGYSVKGDLNVDMQITKLEPDYYMRGKMGFQVDQACSRCAETFPLELKHEFSVALAHASKAKPTPVLADESDQLDVHFFEGHHIELAPLLREQFVLSLPYQSLCGSECKGVCQKCGINLNTSSCGCANKNDFSPFSVLEEIRH